VPFAALLLLAAAAPAEPSRWIPPRIPQAPATSQWSKLLASQTRYLLGSIPPGELASDHENTLRPLTSTAFAAAACLRFGACRGQEQAARDGVLRILRDVTRTHVTGGGRTANGKPWGRQWQSALWAWQAAFAAWLLGDEVPAELRAAVTRMTIEEADRFLDLPAPYAEFYDTKAEENAWNSMILALASEALPGHPHAARWRTRGLEYMISAFAARVDRRSSRLVDGHPLSAWVRGANVHSDFTLENHGFVHPDYMSTTWLNLSNAITYRLAGKAVPEACSFHAAEVYRNLKWLSMPDGGLLYPSGTDWNLHRVDMTSGLHVAMERIVRDPDAAALAALGRETLTRMQARNRDGRTFLPGEFPSYLGHEGQSGWIYATSIMLESLWAPVPKPRPLAEVWKSLLGGRIFDDGRFFVMRSPGAVSSFSWGLRIMGQTVPFASDPILNPVNHSLVGLAGELETGEKPGRTGIGSQALEAALARDPITFSTVLSGEEQGALHVTASARHPGTWQVFSFTALPNGKSVYMERWGDAGPRQGALISLLREPGWVYGTGERHTGGDGHTWFNVDDRMGYAISGGGGIRIVRDIRQTLVSLNAQPSDIALVVALPNATAAGTRAFAASAFRLPVRTPAVAAARVDGWLVVSNLAGEPATAEVVVDGRARFIPVYGFSTRILREGIQ